MPVAACCECGDGPLGSGAIALELVFVMLAAIWLMRNAHCRVLHAMTCLRLWCSCLLKCLVLSGGKRNFMCYNPHWKLLCCSLFTNVFCVILLLYNIHYFFFSPRHGSKWSVYLGCLRNLVIDYSWPTKMEWHLCLWVRHSLRGTSNVREPTLTKINEIGTAKLGGLWLESSISSVSCTQRSLFPEDLFQLVQNTLFVISNNHSFAFL